MRFSMTLKKCQVIQWFWPTLVSIGLETKFLLPNLILDLLPCRQIINHSFKRLYYSQTAHNVAHCIGFVQVFQFNSIYMPTGRSNNCTKIDRQSRQTDRPTDLHYHCVILCWYSCFPSFDLSVWHRDCHLGMIWTQENHTHTLAQDRHNSFNIFDRIQSLKRTFDVANLSNGLSRCNFAFWFGKIRISQMYVSVVVFGPCSKFCFLFFQWIDNVLY